MSGGEWVLEVWSHGSKTRTRMTPGCDRRIAGYAAKVAAETVSAEPPSRPDLSDAALAELLKGCVRPPKAEELSAIRTMFLAYYGGAHA
jgi:hypothetical protein